jgi:hypothetical protein
MQTIGVCLPGLGRAALAAMTEVDLAWPKKFSTFEGACHPVASML